MAATVRAAAERLLSRPSVIWEWLIAGASWAAGYGNAVREVVDESERRRDLPAYRRLIMIRWAHNVVRGAPLPNGFRPSQHLTGERSRAAARSALERRVAEIGDERAREQLVGLTEPSDLDRLLALIGTDIRQRISDRAIRPKRGDGVDPSALLSIVGDVADRLDGAGIRPFLMSGTLLGFLRDGTFLDHDHDVDLGILPSTSLEQVADALTGPGLRVSLEVPDRWLLATHESGLHVDVFRHELREGLFWHSTRIHEWWNTPFELREMNALGRRWWVPDDPERYLDENYGRWSAPVAFFGISFDTPNRTYRPTAEAAHHLYRTCIQGLDDGDRWMVESAARELRDHFGIDVTEHLATTPLLGRDRHTASEEPTEHLAPRTDEP